MFDYVKGMLGLVQQGAICLYHMTCTDTTVKLSAYHTVRMPTYSFCVKSTTG